GYSKSERGNDDDCSVEDDYIKTQL
ncbi:MAG: hypothetical protein JWQ40_2167, partial [Segetibacter sp.]|nr:hypothetical protein [Segetibacter sp.]